MWLWKIYYWIFLIHSFIFLFLFAKHFKYFLFVRELERKPVRRATVFDSDKYFFMEICYWKMSNNLIFQVFISNLLGFFYAFSLIFGLWVGKWKGKLFLGVEFYYLFYFIFRNLNKYGNWDLLLCWKYLLKWHVVRIVICLGN